ncbi:MAG: hypothetical protein FWH36_02675 [Lentimicrobiaceae bacterium]|nr:hypothetical protein [Lentimicrobiaceae bacterium]
MKVRITTLLAILTMTATLNCYGQSYEPMDLAKKLFSKEKFATKKEYITGEYKEMKGRPNGKDLQKGITTQFSLLEQTEETAVVAMTILDKSGNGLDTYLHFKKDKVWKMCAFRALAMTGIIELVIMELEKMTPQEIDEMIADTTNEEFTSREDYDFELGNCKLTLEFDDNIIKHFVANQAEFERLKNLALLQLEKEEVDEERSTKLIENEKNNYQKLFISSVSTGGYELNCNCIDFLIGGILDNTVGYFYIRDKKDLPKMNPNRIIMIREIGNGWYIYKTT